MRDEYDFSDARPNKYATKYAEGTNIVVINPDLMEYFPDSESVNEALSALTAIISKNQGKKKSISKRRHAVV